MTIGERIRTLRKSLNMSQDDLADAIGANRVTISKYETGGYLPSIPALDRLATALHTTPSFLSGSVTNDKWEESERIRRDPNLRILFDQALNAKPEHIRAAAAMLKALEGGNDE
jgi:transcriptional regulator with XRE-family HTH domain